MVRLFIFLIMALMVASGLVHAEPADSRKLPGKTVYRETSEGKLSLIFYWPEGHTPESKAPAMLFFHGGGWKGGAPGQFAGQAKHLAKRGMVAVTAEYRLEKKNGTTPFESLSDAIVAMRYLRQHAESLGLDSKRIGAGGGSAGGHLAIALSTTTAKSLIPTKPADLADSPYHPDALVLFNPVYDNGPGGYGYSRIKERYVDFSPAHNLHAGMPATLVMFGDRDKLVSVAKAEEIRDKMKKLGVRSELIVYPNQAHGFFNFGNKDMFQATLAAMDDFLVSLGWLAPRIPQQPVD